MEQDEFRQLGAQMKEARLEKNISLEKIADRTKINPEFLKKIEEGEFDFLPEFYVRHFLKNYLACISESALSLLDEFEELCKRKNIVEQSDADLSKQETAPKIQQFLEMTGIKRASS